MWNNCGFSSESVSSSSSLSSSPQSSAPTPPPGIMNKYLDPFYVQPPFTYVTTYYDYLVVIDFEATCEDSTGHETPGPIRHERPEIIQFPAVLVNTRTMQVEGTFNTIVRPVEAPELSEFCTRLTGITQNMVTKAPTFPAVLRRFELWLKEHGLALNSRDYGHSFAIVTDGSYDMGHFLYKQCIISQIPYPTYAYRWVNIATIFTSNYRRRWGCLKNAMNSLGLSFEGRAHNGLDDARNIYKVLLQLLRGGCLVYQTEKIALQTGEQKRNESRILNDKSAGKYELATVTPISFKQCEHMVVYANDCWSTHRRVPPEIDYDYPVECQAFEAASDSMMSAYHHGYHHQQANSTSGSCESIASGCSNKENSIPVYIPSTKSSANGKGRGATGPSSPNGKDVICVSAAGVGVGNPVGSSGSGRHGRRKKRNAQLKETNSLKNSVTTNLELESHDGVIVVSANVALASDSDADMSASSREHISHDSQSTNLIDSDDLDSHNPRILSQMG